MPNLSYRKPRMSDLGKVFGVVYRANEKALIMHAEISEELRAYAAPSECADVAYNCCDRLLRDAVGTAEAVTGMTWQEILNEVQARTGGRWFGWTLYNSLIPDPCAEG
jgi:hypothetical protein